jgi:alkylation response protein AidB-like acyl-CoA dehydrogenase
MTTHLTTTDLSTSASTADRAAAATSDRSVLTAEMLARFDGRAAEYDRDNRFFDEDLAELRASGYLDVALPREYGGADLRLDAVGAMQRRLAYHAPATAIAVNMHFYWTGVAADLLRAGDDSMRWVLERAAQGEVFAAGHGEPGNDLGLFASTTQARKVDGGWEFTGHKIFGSLSPVWDWLGIHGMDVSDPEHPSPTSTSRSSARPASPGPVRSRSRCSPGHCSVSPTSTPGSPNGRST